jgi:D-alanyl-D-alanine carboxypeptidase (penicillin-binding protein 5/6)
MRYPKVVYLIVFLTLIGSAISAVSRAETVPEPPSIPVREYILLDFHSGKVLADMRGEERSEPASITKLMTAYVIYKNLREGHIKITDQVTISEQAWRAEGSRTFVQVGSKVGLEDLLMGMIVQSGNDASVALAEHVAGSESAFAELMNQEAERLGMRNSHFMNAAGLPHPNHYTTAHDIALLLQAIIKEFPEDYKRYSVREFTYNNITQPNRNRLLGLDDSVDGGKTGHTSSAGFCLVVSAQRNEMRLISVVLGAKNEKDRVSATQSLLNYGFRFFETRKLYDGNKALTEARLWMGETNNLPLGLGEDLYITTPRGRLQDISTELQVDPTTIEAPVTKGSPYGNVIVTLGQDTLTKAPLLALQDIAPAGFFGRLWDRFILMLYSLF